MQRYIKARCKEISSRLAVFIPMTPEIYPMSPKMTLFVYAVAIIIFAVPQDKLTFKRN